MALVARISSMPTRIRPALLWKRNPTAAPSPTMIASEMTLRMRSVSDRPTRTVMRKIAGATKST
jgi:hypothetical protein